MKQPGIAYPAQKMFFLFLTLMTTNFKQQQKNRIKKSSNEHRLLDIINGVIDCEDLEQSSSYFDISDLNSSFPKNKFNGINFFHYEHMIIFFHYEHMIIILMTYKLFYLE